MDILAALFVSLTTVLIAHLLTLDREKRKNPRN